MALTDTAVRTAKPKDKPYKLSDERGLFLLALDHYMVAGTVSLRDVGTWPDLLTIQNILQPALVCAATDWLVDTCRHDSS